MSDGIPFNKWEEQKKYPHNGWYPKPTIEDVYNVINGLKKQITTLAEQQRDALNLLMELVDSNADVVVVEDGYESEGTGCGENCKCKPQLPFGGETPLDDVVLWLQQQIEIWGRNDATRAVGYQHTLEHIKRLQKFIGE
jgi:hypothetical protein